MAGSWPACSYEDWRVTCDTLHAHTQVLGKLAAGLAPPEPRLQHAALRLTARGWETAPLPAPDGSGSVAVLLDLRVHEAVVEHSGGAAERIPLTPDRAVGEVTRDVLAAVRARARCASGTRPSRPAPRGYRRPSADGARPRRPVGWAYRHPERRRPMTTQALTGERADLLQSLARSRHFLRHTTRGLTDEQAAQRTTASELCLGGLIKHVTLTERRWIRFIQTGPSAMAFDESSMGDWMSAFQMLPGETLAGLLADYDRCAEETAGLVVGLPDLDAAQPLPEAPWFEPGARWSARRVLLHVIAETAQHAGHADIIRESLDGAKSMG